MYVVYCMVHNKLTKGHIEIYVLVFYDVIQSDKLEAKWKKKKDIRDN